MRLLFLFLDETLTVSASPVTSVSPEEVSTIESMDDDEDCLEYEEEEEVIEVRGGWGLDEDDEDDTTDSTVRHLPGPTAASPIPLWHPVFTVHFHFTGSN